MEENQTLVVIENPIDDELDELFRILMEAEYERLDRLEEEAEK